MSAPPNESHTGVAAWSALMDPDFCALPTSQRDLYIEPDSSVVPGSEQGATLSAGAAVSLPRPIFLADEADELEGSGHD